MTQERGSYGDFPGLRARLRASFARALFFLFFISAGAEAEETAAFLKINPGARPMAMGEAFTAVADDLNALTTNPSGLSRLNARQAAFMHAELFAGTRYDFAAYGQPLREGTLGFGVQRLSQASIEGRDASGKATGSFGASDTALSLAYSARLPSDVARLGLGVKFIESKLADSSARTYAVDLGVMRPFTFGRLPVDLGASVRNLGPGLKFEGERNPLPLSVSLGSSVRLAGALVVAVDVSHRPNSHKTSFGVGTEYAVLPSLALRTGYAAASAAGAAGTGSFSGLGLGFGVKVYKAALDYSFSPYGELGSAQRIGLTTKF